MPLSGSAWVDEQRQPTVLARAVTLKRMTVYGFVDGPRRVSYGEIDLNCGCELQALE